MEREPRTVIVDPDAVTITWDDGVTARITGDRLRSACPCAECDQRDGKIMQIIHLQNQSEIVDAVLAGGYAIRFTFADGHADGIYPYRTLYDLGEPVDAG
jgi:DUF971 family protein